MKELIIKKLKDNFSQSIEEIKEYAKELTFVVAKNSILQICKFIKEDQELKFDYLVDICGVDRYKKENRFEVVYNVWSEKLKYRIRLKTKVDEKDLTLDSVCSVWNSANWYERETYDMFGIIFQNHPDLRRIYMPEEYEYFPLRKDFPLMGIPDSLPLPRRNQ